MSSVQRLFLNVKQDLLERDRYSPLAPDNWPSKG